jgi:hypothetical protein
MMSQPMAPPAYGQPVPMGAPVARKTSPIVWVLVIVLGLFVVGGLGVAAFVGFVAHRVHQAARDAGVSFDHNRDGGLTLHTRDQDGKNAVVQFGGKAKVPSWVPVYPGSSGKETFSVAGSDGNGEGGNFSFTTTDDASKVKQFYADKTKDMGMKVNMDTTTPDGGVIIAADDGGDRRTLEVVVGGRTGETAVNVTYGKK